jgi:polysaccharide pyruvyl transferase WcaK-like protein
MNILIYGYYGMKNFGDELFEIVLTNMLKNNNIKFYNPNNLKIIPDDTDIILVGGGDVVNDYFMNNFTNLKINWEKKNNKHLISYILSFGISYPDNIIEGSQHYLDIFDYFITRNKSDYKLLSSRYGTKYVEYLPDLAFLTNEYFNFELVVDQRKEIINSKCTIGIFLARPVYNDGKNEDYNKFLKDIAAIISTLQSKYNIELVTCDWGKSFDNNDLIINNQVYNELDDTTNVIIVSPNDAIEICKLIKKYKFTICMRFHSHILSYLYKVPFISLCMTKKVRYFMEDNEIQEYIIELGKNKSNIYIKDINEIYDKINIIENFKFIENEITSITPQKYLIKIEKKLKRNDYPTYYNSDDLFEKQKKVITNLSDTISKYFKTQNNIDDTNYNSFYKVKDLILFISNKNVDEEDKKLHNILALVIDNTITDLFNSKYFWGINEQLYNLNLLESTKWIMDNMYYYTKKKNDIISENNDLENNSKIKLNLEYIVPQTMNGLHRSGWNYIVDKLFKYNDKKSDIILDLYVDSTFHWNNEILNLYGKIPYTQPWIGVIHHTPDTEYTEYNTTNLLKNELFLSSLKKCICLIVMSTYLKKWFESELELLGIKVKLICILHPTEFVEEIFTIENFINNKNKMLVQIGGWMRNSYTIYALQLNNKKLEINKAYLKGKMMENYFKPPDLNLSNICDKSFLTNKYVSGMIKDIITKHNSVIELQNLNNDDYDDLLTKNIVFLNLIEASACNTVIECIVRNTPIIINRIEPIIELLGENYPLFYDNIAEASEYSTNIDKIIEGHNYLKKLDKNFLKIETFINDFENEISKLL